MHRRTFLALAGTGAVAGCLGGGNDEPSTAETARSGTDDANGTNADETTTALDGPTGTDSDGGEEGAATETGTGTMEPTPQPTPIGLDRGVEIREHRLRSDDGEVGVLATVVNGGEKHSGRITLRSRFRNGAGEVASEAESSVADLAPEETWAAYVPYRGDDPAPDAVASYELAGDVMAEAEVPSFYHPDLSFESFSLRRTDSETYLTATVKNAGDEAVPFLQANGYFHESKDVVLASNTTTTEGLGAGETWSFEIPSEMPAFRREQIGTQTASLTKERF